MSADNYLVAQRMNEGWWVLEGWMSFQGEREILLAKFLTQGEALAYCQKECHERGEYGSPVEYGVEVRLTGTMNPRPSFSGRDHGEQFDYIKEP